jgi:hypothetical protein
MSKARKAAEHAAAGYKKTEAGRFFASATDNFHRIRARSAGRRGTERHNPCSDVEHYTDVIAEATVATVMAGNDDGLANRADKLRATATRAQRGAVAACALRGKR